MLHGGKGELYSNCITGMMAKTIVRIIKKLTFNRVRGLSPMYSNPSLQWWWTPWTYHFAHGGWICLDLRWLWRFRNGAKSTK